MLCANNIWFQDIDSSQRISRQKFKNIVNIIYQAIAHRDSKLDSLQDELDYDKEPRLIFFTISDDILRVKILLGRGKGLLEAINNALVQTMGMALELKSLKVDLVQEVHQLEYKGVDQKIEFDRSLYGLAFEQRINLAYLPEQVISYTLINTRQHLKLRNLAKYNFLTEHEKYIKENSKSLTLYFFDVQSYYQSGSFQSPLYRGHQIFEGISIDLLLSSATLAGDYLKSAVKKNGDFVYEYLPKRDKTNKRYNILRHAGTVYAMLELYEVTKNEMLLKSAKLALSNLVKRAKSLIINNESVLCIVENDYVKLGANALTLLAISKYILITKDISYLEIGKKLASWIGAVQNSKGEFYIHKMKFSTKANTHFVSGYYPGEVIYSLAKFYQVDPNPVWLDIAQKATDFLIEIRDVDKKIAELEHDHWLLYGLNELFQFRPSPTYILQTFKITKAIMRSQNVNAEPGDYKGSFYANPRSTPAAIRAEGLCAAFKLLKRNNYENDANEILNAINLCIQFQLQTQFLHERILYLPNPKRALGGFSKSLTDYSIRIDYVQHNISSLLGLYHILSKK